MFDTLKTEMLSRIHSVERLFTATRRLDDEAVIKETKGLVFVQLYALYEHTVVSSVSKALELASSHKIEYRLLRNGLKTFALHSVLESVVSTKRRVSWPKRLALFEMADASDTVESFEQTFPDDGTHFRSAQIQTIWKLFEIQKPAFSHPIHMGRINEVVEHRNAIAHGRETAATIGGRFTNEEITHRIGDMRDVCQYLIDTICDHFSSPANLKKP